MKVKDIVKKVKVDNIIKKAKVILPVHALQVLLSLSLGTGGSQKAEEYLKFSLENESQKYNRPCQPE